LKCWMAPRDVAAGSVWDEAILDAIETSRVFLLILSKSANDSQYVKNEVNRAFSERKPIVTFRIEDVMPGRSLQLYLARHHWTDAFPPPLVARVETLATSITALLDSSAASAAIMPAAAERAAQPGAVQSAAPAAKPSFKRTLITRAQVLWRSKWWQSTAALGAIAAVAAAVAAGSLYVAYRATRPVQQPLMRFSDDAGSEISLAGVSGPAVAISPDGSRLAFVVQSPDNTTRIAQRLLENPKATTLVGTEGGEAPFFSPDGLWIGFFAQAELKKISVDGGAATTVYETGENVRGGGFWGEDGNIYFANQRTPVMRVSPSGGTPSPVMPLQNGEVTNRAAQLLPGNEALLFEASADNNSWVNATIQVIFLKTGKRKTLIQGGYFGRFIHGSDPEQGHLLYMKAGTLYAAPMNARRAELTGAAVPMVEDVPIRAINGLAHIAISNSGSMVYVEGSNAATQVSMAWLDGAGGTEVLRAPPQNAYFFPRLSPDGKRIAMTINEPGGRDLWVYDWTQNRFTRLTFIKQISTSSPVWTPDGKHILFRNPLTSELQGLGTYWMRSDGGGQTQLLMTGDVGASSFSPDGKRLAYTDFGVSPGIWTLPIDSTDPEHPKAGKPELFLASKDISPASAPEFSPDGRWIAFALNQSGRFEIFVRPFPGPGGQWQITNSGGWLPRWGRDGHTLYFHGGLDYRQIMAASYTVSGDSFAAGEPRSWSGRMILEAQGFDLAPDGKRALAVVPASGTASAIPSTHVNVLLNFEDELQRKAPMENK